MSTSQETIMFATRRCIVCNLSSVIELDRPGYLRWRSGEYVQNVWPEKTSDERELLVTGTHPECWEQMFGEEEE